MAEQQFRISGVEALTAFRDAMKDAIRAYSDDDWTNEEVLTAVQDCLDGLVYAEAVAAAYTEEESDDD